MSRFGLLAGTLTSAGKYADDQYVRYFRREGGYVNWTRSYQMEKPPEDALSWAEYERIIITEWTALLSREPASLEPEVQAFLERHPSMVPGAFELLGGESGHYPWLCGLITQPPLPSYDRRVPDFMWLSQSSDTEQPVLIEIEAPSKRWFTKAGKQTKELTQALNQIAEWKAWFGVPHNVEAFKAFYGLDCHAWQRRRFRPAYLLIYGRRAEANADPSLTQKRTHLHADDVITMTYDRLRPNPKANDLVCLRVQGRGAFCVVSVPPTLRWTPSLADERALVSGWDAAIDANPNISRLRKDFLIKRRPYWDEWGSRETKETVNFGDKE